jgi:hypothetical protein
MKRRLILSILLLAGAFGASAQMAWHVQNTGFATASRGIRAVDVKDSNVVWATAYNGTTPTAYIREFTKTRNGGASWFPGNIVVTGLNATHALANISAIDADTAYASIFPTGTSAAPQGVYKTTNGGTTWVKASTGKFTAASSFINVVHFFDALNGVALGDPAAGTFEIYTTGNAGNTWERVAQVGTELAPIAADEYGTIGYYGAFGSTIVYPTTYGRVMISKDKGLTWTLGNTPLNAAVNTFIPTITFKDLNTAYAIIGNVDSAVATYMISNDGGVTWGYSGVDTAAQVFDFNDIEYVPGTLNTFFISSANATTGGAGSSYSEDGGATWINIDNLQHTCLGFSDINNGWSGGFNTSATVGGMYKWGSVRTAVGINNNKVQGFQVYPNPSTERVYVRANVNGASSIRVMDLMGRVIFEENYATQSLLFTSVDLSAEAKGVYFVEVRNGANASVEKIVIQ